ncbi:MAG: cyclic nucleotide-binding domain-containing protein, partial [Alphaproteobacteria bacterium]|nr:cyclic nucleotide-binding domain-containing protein [Alphaproteobacteria bacterium]
MFSGRWKGSLRGFSVVASAGTAWEFISGPIETRREWRGMASKHDQTLSRMNLFADLAPDEIREVESVAKWHEVPAGETIFDQENDTLEVFCVVSGAVRIMTSVGDRDVTLAEIQADNVFGEIAAIDNLPRSAKAIATADSVLASIDGPAFIKMMTKYPAIAIKVIKRLARVVRGLDKRVTTLSTL